jgi:hypothetical protein
MPAAKRSVRIGGASGGFADRQRAIHDLAKDCNVDVIIGGRLLQENVHSVYS